MSPETPTLSTLNEPPSLAALNVTVSIDGINEVDNESAPCVSALNVTVSIDGTNHVVNVSGELDIRTRQLVEQACLAGPDGTVVVEMSQLTFMDCCGYAGLIGIRRALVEQGGSLTLTNQVGQPARLLALLGAVESMRQAETTGATMT